MDLGLNGQVALVAASSKVGERPFVRRRHWRGQLARGRRTSHGVPVPIISQAVMQLFASRDEMKNWARAIAMMRHGFGGHAYGPSEAVVRERREERIGGFVRQ